nr:integrase core domain-containing protein [Arthrobacter cavernae]
MTTFCQAHDISRKTFYKILAIARDEGQAAALEPRSRRPKTSPTRLDETVKAQSVKVRAALESSGLDHGPISVHDKMKSLGMTAPSTAALARIFREKNLARNEPKKKPRAAWRRFVYPAPNACWQLDATEYVLTGGRKCVIFQLQDDHSRLAIASHVASGETTEAALTVARKGMAAHGVPQRLLTDNGSALNPTRLGVQGQLVTYMNSLGVSMITGKPYKPTTQGKNERFHQTLFRYLDKQPIAASLNELQGHVDRFDVIYNAQRPHQGLPGRITPQQAWEATEKAEPPRPRLPEPEPAVPRPTVPAAALRPAEPTLAADHDEHLLVVPEQKILGSFKTTEPSGRRTLKVYSNGTVRFNDVVYCLTTRMAHRQVVIDWEREAITFINSEGEIIAEFNWPPVGTKHVGIKSARYAFQQTAPQ